MNDRLRIRYDCRWAGRHHGSGSRPGGGGSGEGQVRGTSAQLRSVQEDFGGGAEGGGWAERALLKGVGGGTAEESAVVVPLVEVRSLDESSPRSNLVALPGFRLIRDRRPPVRVVLPRTGGAVRPRGQAPVALRGDGGSPLSCSAVQAWYDEEPNKATGGTKRCFVLVVELVVSVGDELVFMVASDVYPTFHDASRSLPQRDLAHRHLCPTPTCSQDCGAGGSSTLQWQ